MQISYVFRVYETKKKGEEEVVEATSERIIIQEEAEEVLSAGEFGIQKAHKKAVEMLSEREGHFRPYYQSVWLRNGEESISLGITDLNVMPEKLLKKLMA